MSLFGPKIAGKDFHERDLPSTRRGVYFDVVHLHWSALLVCGVLLLAASAVFFVTGILESNLQINIHAMVEGGEMEQADAIVTLVNFRCLLAAADIIGWVLFGVVLAGVAQLLRAMGWEEPFRIFPDFCRGVRQNGKQYTLLFLLVGALQFACRYPIITGSGFFVWLPAIVCLLIPAPAAAYMLVTIPVYEVKFTQQMRYALLTYGRAKLKTLLAFFLCLLLPACMILSDLFFPLPVALPVKAILLLLLPFVLLAWFLFAFERLDRAINGKFYPELVGRGLHLDHYEDDSSWLDEI